jgi:hypothetical protein
MNFGRQVTGGFINNSGFYVASGPNGTGGDHQMRSMEVFFMGAPLPPNGDPLVAGQIAPAESSFNMGIVANGQSLSKSFDIRHISGNQGVIIASMAISGDPAFKLKTQVAAPFLLRPGKSTPVEITFSSTGAVPQASTLDITCAVPPGLILKVPLDANRTAAAIAPPRKAASAGKTPVSRSVTPVFEKSPGNGLWNSLGKKTGNPQEQQ